ncbi:MAG TPA: DUF6468 domain-containing protein [Geminicoccaceae bacterium]|nr:DUF6468 domain-containing protein [Geminicoccaceae bacterium]
MSLDWVLDLLVAGLLLATIAYCALLHRRLRLLRGGERAELARFVEAFDHAVRRAGGAIEGLGRASEEAAARLAGPTGEAARLAHDLRLLVERGERVADRLAAAASDDGRSRAPVPAPSGRGAAAAATVQPDATELRRVLEALR